MTVIIQKHQCWHTEDQHISNDTDPIRQFAEEDETPDGCENDQCIIINGDFSGRGILVGGCDAKLTYGCACACTDQNQKLLQCHRFEEKDNVRQCRQAWKCRKKEHDERPFFTFNTKLPPAGVRTAGTHTADEAAKRRKCGCQIKRWLDDKQTADKSDHNGNTLEGW